MKTCDLVMRGGVTSGIVYPNAIVRLSADYQFRQVGGASAGAIAAAFAAAAEYGRKTGKGGFKRLEGVPNELGSGLEGYFQPFGAYKKLFKRILKRQKENKKFGAWFFIWNALSIWRALKKLPKTNFGICPGTTRSEQSPKLGLIDWLNRQIEFIAGETATVGGALPTKPLTFGMLADRGVILRLITTNLSQQRPFNLPLGDGFYLLREDLDWLLPENVASWILGQDPDATSKHVKIPKLDDMPVILAVRMSLSFPVLFSAVPVYTHDRSLRVKTPECVAKKSELQRNLFSDGGLSSNFPIHYFDAILPNCPTFGINLSDYYRCRHGDDTGKEGWNRIYMPSVAGDGITYGLNPIEGLGAFAGSLLTTAKDWQDSVQARMPGYRERIVHVALNDDEGGLNLTMDSAVIQRLIGFGDLAGARILSGHGDPNELPKQTPFHFQAHRWRRLLAATHALSGVLPKIVEALTVSNPPGEPGALSIRDLILDLERNYSTNEPYFDELGYRPPDVGELRKLLDLWDAVVQLNATWQVRALKSNWNLPSPEAGLRLRSDEF